MYVNVSSYMKVKITYSFDLVRLVLTWDGHIGRESPFIYVIIDMIVVV